MTKAGLRKTSVKKVKLFRAECSECFNSWMTVISVPQISKTDKAVIKTSLKSKNNTEKFDSVSISFDSLFKIVIKCICQNCASVKDGFAGWLRVPDHKLHELMLWDPEENAKRQRLQKRLFERNISFIIEILRENVESKMELLMSLIKIEKHYSSVYIMCQILMSATNMEIPFTDWDILFKFTISKHENRIQHDLQHINRVIKILINTEKDKT